MAPYLIVEAGVALAGWFGVSVVTGILPANTILFSGMTTYQLYKLEAAQSEDERIEIFVELLLNAGLFGMSVAEFYGGNIATNADAPYSPLAPGGGFRLTKVRAVISSADTWLKPNSNSLPDSPLTPR